jgi:CheY-like chemotaxis protein
VFLPAQEQPGSDARTVERVDMPSGNGELVLVVDDEQAIRTLTQRTLEVFNYRVLTAANGAEGIAICAREDRGIALVLTDIAMPIMDGIALAAAIRTLLPKLKIVVASGLAEIPPGGLSSRFADDARAKRRCEPADESADHRDE